MASRKTAVRLTANFEENLASIEEFCLGVGAPQTYDALLNSLLDTVIPNLEQHPNLGRSLSA